MQVINANKNYYPGTQIRYCELESLDSLALFVYSTEVQSNQINRGQSVAQTAQAGEEWGEDTNSPVSEMVLI